MQSVSKRGVLLLVCTVLLAVDADAQSVIPGPGATGGGGPTLRKAGQTPPQQVTGELVGFICPPGNILGANLQNRCNEIATEILGTGGDLAGALAGLQAMAPEENSAVQTSDVDASQARGQDVRDRLEQRRDECNDPQSRQRNGRECGDKRSAFNVTVDGQRLSATELLGATGGGASADSFGTGPWGVFLNGNFGITNKDSSARETGFHMNSYGVNGGVDYRFDQSLLGVSIGYTTQDADLKANSGKLNSDAVTVSLYGSYYPSPQSYVNAIFSYTNTDHDQKRNIAYTINSFLGTSVINQVASSSTNSDEVAGSLEAGYDFLRNDWTITPYARLDIADTNIDGYTESLSAPAAGTVASGMALQLDGQSFTSVTTAFGGRLGTVVSAAKFDVYPQIGAEYVHEFDNDNKDTRARLVDDTSGSTFLLPTDKPDRDYGNVSAGLTADFRNGWYGHVQYQGLVGYKDLDVHVLEIGARLQF
jgi:uncharacterized protein YhjY with autotransporter beta-barrel domain